MLTFDAFQSSSVWEMPDPDKPTHIHAGATRAELVSAIVNYRAQNGLPPLEKLNLVIDNYLCGLPCNTGKCKELVLSRGILQYIKGGLVLLQNVFYGEKNMVSQEVAEKRAATCRDCVFNIFPDRDNFITWSDNIALHSTGGRRASLHDSLGNCQCCSCTLKAKVFYKGPFILSKEESDCMHSANVKCWQLKD